MSMFFDTGNFSYDDYNNKETGKRLLPDINITPKMIPQGLRISGAYDSVENKFKEFVVELSNTKSFGSHHSHRILSDFDDGYVKFANIITIVGVGLLVLSFFLSETPSFMWLAGSGLLCGVLHFLFNMIYYNFRKLKITVTKEGIKFEKNLLNLFPQGMFIDRASIMQFYCINDHIIIRDRHYYRGRRRGLIGLFLELGSYASSHYRIRDNDELFPSDSDAVDYKTVTNLSMMTTSPYLKKPFLLLKNFSNLGIVKYIEQEMEKTLGIDDVPVEGEIQYTDKVKAKLANAINNIDNFGDIQNGYQNGYDNQNGYNSQNGYQNGYDNQNGYNSQSGYQNGYDNQNGYNSQSGYQNGYDNQNGYNSQSGYQNGYDNQNGYSRGGYQTKAYNSRNNYQRN